MGGFGFDFDGAGSVHEECAGEGQPPVRDSRRRGSYGFVNEVARAGAGGRRGTPSSTGAGGASSGGPSSLPPPTWVVRHGGLDAMDAPGGFIARAAHLPLQPPPSIRTREIGRAHV